LTARLILNVRLKHVKENKMTRVTKVMAAILVCMSISGMVYAGTAKDTWTDLVGKRSSKRPEFAFVQNNPALPNVLIYGDSISMGYTLQVRKKLKNRANVYRLHCNGGDISKVIPAMTKMHKKMAEHWSFKWDVIHFNTGLHDLKYLDKNKKYDTKKGKQVHSTEDYKKGLKGIIEYFKEIAPDAKIIFATTTPVPEKSRGRIAGDAVKYNKAAIEVLKGYPEIGINDLYGLTKPNQSKWWKGPGNVHYTKLGTTAQGDMVASTILNTLEKNKKAEQKNPPDKK
jgi:hypothetical protein